MYIQHVIISNLGIHVDQQCYEEKEGEGQRVINGSPLPGRWCVSTLRSTGVAPGRSSDLKR